MAQPGDEIKRELPRLSKTVRQVEQSVAKNGKSIKNNTNAIENNQQQINKNTQEVASTKQKVSSLDGEVRDVKRRLSSTEKVVANVQKATNEVANRVDKAQQTANQAQSVAAKAVNQKQLQAIQNSVTALNRNFSVVNRNLNSSFSGIQTKLANNSLLFNNQQQDLQSQVQQVNQQVSSSFQQIQILKSDLSQGLKVLQADILDQKQSTLALSTTVDKKLKTDLKEQKQREKQVRIEAATKRKEIRENILEGARKAATNTAGALNNTTNSMLGGFNLLDALKGVLGKLLLGLVVTNFDRIYNFLEENISKWKRVAAIFIRKAVRPISRFFNAVIDLGAKLLKWTFNILDGARKFFGEVIGFGLNLGKRVISSITNFVSSIWRAGQRLLGINPDTKNRNNGNTTDGKANSGGSSGAPSGGKGGETGKPKSWFQSTTERIGSGITKGLKWAGSKAYDAGNAMTGGGLDQIKDFIKKNLKKAAEFVQPITSAVSTAKGKLIKSAQSGDSKGVTEAIGDIINTVKSKGDSWYKKLDEILGPVGKAVGRLGGAGAGFLSGLGREFRIGFPIDLLINKYLLKQDWTQAIARAAGSTIGSWLAPFPGGGIIGGEAGDYLVSATGRTMGYNWNTEDNLLNLIPGVQEWVDGIVSGMNPSAPNADGSPNSSTGITKKISLLPQSGSSSGSGIQATGSAPPPQISPNASIQSIASVPTNQYLRRPTTSAGKPSGGGTGEANGNSNITHITMPTKSVEAPTQVVNNGPSVSKQEANPLPDIDSSNLSMQFYENYAASQFNLQLV